MGPIIPYDPMLEHHFLFSIIPLLLGFLSWVKLVWTRFEAGETTVSPNSGHSWHLSMLKFPRTEHNFRIRRKKSKYQHESFYFFRFERKVNKSSYVHLWEPTRTVAVLIFQYPVFMWRGSLFFVDVCSGGVKNVRILLKWWFPQLQNVFRPTLLSSENPAIIS